MKWKELERVADKGTIKTRVHHSFDHIIKVSFSSGGIAFEGQFDPDNEGVYAIGCNDEDFVRVANILAENGDKQGFVLNGMSKYKEGDEVCTSTDASA